MRSPYPDILPLLKRCRWRWEDSEKGNSRYSIYSTSYPSSFFLPLLLLHSHPFTTFLSTHSLTPSPSFPPFSSPYLLSFPPFFPPSLSFSFPFSTFLTAHSLAPRPSPSLSHSPPSLPSIHHHYIIPGGETHFPLLDLTVTPKKGKGLLWPSTYDYDPSIVRYAPFFIFSLSSSFASFCFLFLPLSSSCYCPCSIFFFIWSSFL